MKTLIAYYSRSGRTKTAAEKIAELTGGKLLEICEAEPYPAEYRQLVNRVLGEIQTDARPAIQPVAGSSADWDALILGTPNWCGTMAPPLMTFLQQWDWSGKKILPFGTNGGGGTGRLAEDVARLVPNGKIAPVLDLPDPEDTEKIRRWLEAQL